jgi:hypothetical protein
MGLFCLSSQGVTDLAGLADATTLTHLFFRAHAGGALASDKAAEANPVCSHAQYAAAVRKEARAWWHQ